MPEKIQSKLWNEKEITNSDRKERERDLEMGEEENLWWKGKWFS